MRSTLLISFWICNVLGSTGAFSVERTTPVVFANSPVDKFKFNTNYSLPYGNSEDFLLGVVKQRSLGTFQQTSVSQTDEFIDAISKRLVEFSQISKELEAELNKPLPEVKLPHLKMVILETTVSSGNPKTPKAPWEYSMEAVDLKIAEIENNLNSKDRASGLRSFLSMRTFIENNLGAPYLESARARMNRVEKDNFSNGILKSHALSDLSSVIDQASSKSKFIRNMLNHCIVEPDCDATTMRVLAANVDLIGSAGELSSIESQLQQMNYKLPDYLKALEIVSKFYAMQKLKACSDMDCSEAKAYYVQNLTETYKVREDIAKIFSDNIFTSKANL